MDNSDIASKILKHVGGNVKNNLNEVLKSFDDSEDEIKTFGYSPYIDISNLHTNVPKDKFTVLSMNIQSIFAKFDNLLAALDQLNNDDFKFSAICLQECWLHDGHDLDMLKIPNYQLIPQKKKCCGHGGLIIYLHEDFTYTAQISGKALLLIFAQNPYIIKSLYQIYIDHLSIITVTPQYKNSYLNFVLS